MIQNISLFLKMLLEKLFNVILFDQSETKSVLIE